LASYWRYIDFTHQIAFTPISLGFLLHNAGFHYFEISSSHIESKLIRRLKSDYARLVRYELEQKEPILTLNLFCVAFKDEGAFLSYKARAKRIYNDYNNADFCFEATIRLKSFLKKIPFLHKTVKAIQSALKRDV